MRFEWFSKKTETPKIIRKSNAKTGRGEENNGNQFAFLANDGIFNKVEPAQKYEL